MDERLERAFPEQHDAPAFIFVAQQREPDCVYASDRWPDGLEPRQLAPNLREDWKSADEEWIPPGESDPPTGPPHEPFRDTGEELAKIIKPVSQEIRKVDGRKYRFNLFEDSSDLLLIGRSYDSVDFTAGDLLTILPWLVPLLAALNFAFVSYVTRRALQPLHTITNAVEKITSRGLSKSLKLARGDREFEQLVHVLNGMLERLHGSFNRTRQFSAFAAHEIKTPLTILRVQIENEMRHEEPGSERQQFLANLMKDVSRLRNVTEKLLLLFRADAGNLQLHVRELDLAEVLRKLVEDAEILAPELEIESRAPHELKLMADRSLLTQAVQNLVSNAIRHNRRRPKQKGFLRVELTEAEGNARVRVTNSSREIPAELRARLFTMFYRGDRSGSDFHGGAGLGLLLTREITRAHGGDVELVQSNDEETVFELWLPVVKPPAGERKREGDTASTGSITG